MVDFLPGSAQEWQSGVPGQTVFQDLCPNPDCPSKAEGFEPAVAPEQAARLEQAIEASE